MVKDLIEGVPNETKERWSMNQQESVILMGQTKCSECNSILTGKVTIEIDGSRTGAVYDATIGCKTCLELINMWYEAFDINPNWRCGYSEQKE